MKPTNSRSNRQSRFQTTTDGEGIANHVGSAAIRDLTDVLGFTRALSLGMAGSRQRRYDPSTSRSASVMASITRQAVAVDGRDRARQGHRPAQTALFHGFSVGFDLTEPVRTAVFATAPSPPLDVRAASPRRY